MVNANGALASDAASYRAGQALAAQVGAEIKNRLRSPATLVAFFVILVGSYWAIPPADGRAVSMSWTLPDGRLQSPLYTAGYLGIAMAVLGLVFFMLAAFYIVAGSVRRDRERGIGAILAATPMSKTAYLGAKWAANAAYLALLSLFCLPLGVFHFARSGVGPFDAVQFFAPLALVVLPAAYIAACALLFDVTPVLRSRGGLVLWFLLGVIPLMAITVGRTHDDSGRLSADASRDPIFDPLGFVMHERMVQASLPAGAHDISSGYVFHDQSVERVAWSGLRFPSGLVGGRLLNTLWGLLPFLAAVLIFDRFDPARGGWRTRRRSAAAVAASAPATPSAIAAGTVMNGGPAPAPARSLATLAPAQVRLRWTGAVLAETRMLWDSAGRAKWLLLPAVALATLLPGDAARLASAAFMLLLVPMISEVACREDLAGTRPLVFSQPAVPRSPVLWKFAAVASFLLALSFPLLVRGAVAGSGQAFSVLLGMLFLAAFAVGSATLTRGGKLFSGVFLLLWYLALNGLPAVDFTGLLAGKPRLEIQIWFLAIGASWLGAAVAWERRRARGV